MYDTMLEALGPSDWWPADSPFEVAVGAILTQNTNWQNVEKALENLKKADCLNAHRMLELSPEELAELIRPAGYFRIKTGRLRNMLAYLRDEADWEIEALAGRDMEQNREGFLSVKGIGPETADAIVLYALGQPTFVVDAYTHRMFHRHGLIAEDADYHSVQELFMDNLPSDAALFNEYHALIVRVGKEWCLKKQGLCETCPLGSFLE